MGVMRLQEKRRWKGQWLIMQVKCLAEDLAPSQCSVHVDADGDSENDDNGLIPPGSVA